MDILFNSPLTFILFLITIICFAKLPRRIEAMYYKKNIISDSRKMTNAIDYIIILIWIGSSIYYIITYGFESLYTYFFIAVIILFIGLIGYSHYKISYKNSKRVFVRNVYFSKEGIANEIEVINQKYPNITFQISAADSIMRIFIESDTKDLVPSILNELRKEESLFQNLNEKKFKKKLVIETISLMLSVIYLISFLIYNILQ